MPFITDNNLSYLTNKLCDSSNIKVTGNSKGNRVNTVLEKIVDKIDEVTNAVEEELTNNNHFYKVGTGNNNVDLSADVQDGFGEVGIKGVTYQNVLNNFSYDSEISKYITANNKTIKWTKPEITSSNINIKYHNSLAQTGKVYTLIFYIYKNTLQIQNAGNSYNVAKFNVISYNGGTFHISSNKTGWVKAVLIQPTTITSDGKPYLEVYREAVGELEMSYPILLEGDHTNNVTPTTHFEGIIGLGDKSKNLFDRTNPSNIIDGYGTGTVIKYDGSKKYRSVICKIKGGNTYTITKKASSRLAIDCTELYPSNNVASIRLFNENYGTKATVTVPAEKNYLICYVYNQDYDNGIDINKLDIQIEEGTIATDYQPYESYKIETLSHGKNLLETSNLEVGTSVDVVGKNWDNCKKDSNTRIRMKNIINADNGQSYTINGPNSLQCVVKQFDLYNVGIADRGWVNMPYTFTTQDKTAKIVCMFKYPDDRDIKINNIVDANIQIEKSSSTTNFEPYQEDRTQVLLDEPLMKLPNGVYDEITKDGKLIKRVGKVVLNGSESWGLNADLGNGRSQFVSPVIQSKVKPNNQLNIINDKLVVKREETSNGIWLYSYLNQNTYYTNIVVHYNITNIPEFKQWLSANPITVYYELSTPIITEIDPVTLRIFKDGHVKFNTLIAPESTHVVQLNKPAQIERNIKEVQKLNNKFNELENFYDDIILETNHKLNLLNFDFEYTKSLKESEEI